MSSHEEVEQDLSHIHWSWPEAIAANPARSLANADLAMDYFAYSPFWDSKSNNNVLRTQRRVENPTYGHAEEKIELNAFKSGFEYIISHSQPPELFVIQRREVESTGKRDRVTGSWFILHDRVYQAPTVYDVVSTRLRNAAHLISKTLGALSENRPPSNPRATPIWRSVPPSTNNTKPSLSTSDVNVTDAEGVVGDGADGEEVEKGDEADKAEFDWHLFHALQSTRSALPQLDELASKPVPPSDPMAELKSIEANMAAQFGFPPGPGQRPNSVRSRSVSALGQRGTTSVGTPGPGLGMGMSPATGSIGGMTPSLMGPGTSPRIAGLGSGLSPMPGLGARTASVAAPSPMNTTAWAGQL